MSIKTSNSFDLCYLAFCLILLFTVGLIPAGIAWFLHFVLVEPREPGNWGENT
jgi:hypothetical protein